MTAVAIDMSKKVCVIGAGASGFACIKECKEAGFLPTCYEKSPYTGGVWRYQDDQNGTTSVAKSTVINSSKEISAFSDFVPPKEFPNYCHHTLMVKYLDLYAAKNDLFKHIKTSHQVSSVTPAPSYEKTGRWCVRVKNLKSGEELEETYDAVFCCTGLDSKAHLPSFPGQDRFKGRIIHTQSWKTSEGFEGKNVVVVGIGNSALDAAVDLSSVTKNCYLSTRRGAWIFHRVGPDGLPIDIAYFHRWLVFLRRFFPLWIQDTILESICNSRFDHSAYGLRPKHRFFQQGPAVNDALPNKLISGAVVVKGDIREFTENGVIFSGEETETPIDVVILATGYKPSYPYLDESISTLKGDIVELYKFMYNPRLVHPETLIFAGLIRPFGPVFPLSEMQARWACHLLSSEKPLPSPKMMLKDIQRHKKQNRYGTQTGQFYVVDWVTYMDEIASKIGVQPNTTKYFFTDPVLWFHMVFGPTVSYYYRLNGPGKWEGAREAIVSVMERVRAPLNHTNRINKANTIDTALNFFVEFASSFYSAVILRGNPLVILFFLAIILFPILFFISLPW